MNDTALAYLDRPVKQRWRRAVLMLVVPIVAAIAGGYFYLLGGRFVSTENAYVKADKVPVSADIAGRVYAVLVQENQTVAAGQPLFRLDAAPFQVAVARADARLAQVRTDLAALKASYRAKQADIALARTKLAFAEKDRDRQADLMSRNFISAAKFDDARQGADIARQQIDALEQDLRRIAETLGGSIDTPAERHPSYRAAVAELDQAKLDLARVEVRAPVAGTVAKPPKAGQYVAAGALAMALVASGDLWIEANFTETDLTHVQPGQTVTVRVDTYPDALWRGTVESLAPATSAEFSVLPAQNASGNWVKIAQRVSVRVALEPAPDAPPLRAGLSAVVSIDTRHRRQLLGFSL